MINDKKKEDQERDAKETAFDNGQSPESVKKNPNPRANGNLPEDEQGDNSKENTTGVGSEITDGEAS